MAQSRRPRPTLGFTALSVDAPTRLAAWIRHDVLPPAELAAAAAALGRHRDAPAVRRTLVPLLVHADPGVRRGALDGLAPHLDDATRDALRARLDGESDETVRAHLASLLGAVSGLPGAG